MSLPRPGLRAHVAVLALSSPLEVGADQAPVLAAALGSTLCQAGCEVLELGSVDTPEKSRAAGRQCAEEHVDAIAAVTASWFEDYPCCSGRRPAWKPARSAGPSSSRAT